MNTSGVTLKSFADTYEHLDDDGNVVGHTNPNPLSMGEYIQLDSKGNLIGYTKPNLLGGYLHYNKNMELQKYCEYFISISRFESHKKQGYLR